MELKPISLTGIPEAISKVEVYRYLNEPGEASLFVETFLRRSRRINSVATPGPGNTDSVYTVRCRIGIRKPSDCFAV